MKTTTRWQQGMNFVSEYEGHPIKLSGSAASNGSPASGFSPKSLLLSGLAGCSGIDVVEILTKMKVPFTLLEIQCESEPVVEHPKVFKDIFIEYKIDAPHEAEEKVLRAIQLSLEKYCGVAAMLGRGRKIIPKLMLV